MSTVLQDGAQLCVGRPRDAADYLTLERIYRRVFGIDAGSGSINARLLASLDRHGGIVVLVRQRADIVGFAFSFLSRDTVTQRLYQYSQVAAVLPEAQGRGIGRVLKRAQGDAALASGVDLMRWAFDPMRARNAHVNLDVLGGIVRTFTRDLYGDAAHGRDRGDRTDRFVVDWELRGEPRPVHPALPELPAPGEAVVHGDRHLVPVPADWETARARIGLDAALALRERVAHRFETALSAGLVGVSCVRVSADLACYVFAPDPTDGGTR